jgi:hypothetical protein
MHQIPITAAFQQELEETRPSTVKLDRAVMP